MESRIQGDLYVRFGGGFSETCYSNIIRRRVPIQRFKGKFIYWGLGCILAGLVLGALTMSLINMWLGAIVLIGCMTGGLFYIAGKQKNGLHDKSRSQDIFIHQLTLKKINQYGRKTSF